jgi:hypothetical protein
MALVFILWYLVEVASYLVASTWVTIVCSGQSLVNNASTVLGFSILLDMSVPHGQIEVGCGSDNHWTFCIPPYLDIVIGVCKV